MSFAETKRKCHCTAAATDDIDDPSTLVQTTTKTEILLRSPTPSGYRLTDDKRGPFTGRTLSSGHRDRTLADDPQVPCADGRVVDPADVTR